MEELRRYQAFKVQTWLSSLSVDLQDVSSLLEEDWIEDHNLHAETRPQDPLDLFLIDNDLEEVSVDGMSETYSETHLDSKGYGTRPTSLARTTELFGEGTTGSQNDSTEDTQRAESTHSLFAGKAEVVLWQASRGPRVKLSFSSTRIIGRVELRVRLPTQIRGMIIGTFPVRQYAELPEHRPILRRDTPVRVALPGLPACYIFPSFERSDTYVLRKPEASVDGTIATNSTTFYTALSVRSKTTTSTATFFTAPVMVLRSGVVLTELSRPIALEESGYFKLLLSKGLILPPSEELNWSGRGQHPEFLGQELPPLQVIGHMGSSASAVVEKVRCRRIVLARKMMRCWRRWTLEDALQEVEHLNKLRHAHIVQLIGTYRQNRTFAVLLYPAADCHLGTFLDNTADVRVHVSPLVDSGSYQTSVNLDDWDQLRQREESLNTCLACLASALAYIHRSTIKHLDIKPANILVKKTPQSIRRTGDPEYRVYIADFGLSQDFKRQDHSQSEERVGRTPKYCAPEVHGGLAYGRSADIFSLGCVYLEILTVLSGLDLEDFADFRRGKNGTDLSYHAHLPEVSKWLGCLLQKKAKGGTDHPSAMLPYSCMLSYLYRMVNYSPAQRPTAEGLVKLFRGELHGEEVPASFRSRSCCLRAPEPWPEANKEEPIDMNWLHKWTGLPRNAGWYCKLCSVWELTERLDFEFSSGVYPLHR